MTFTGSHFTLGIRPQHFWVCGCAVPIQKRSRAPSRKGMSCLFWSNVASRQMVKKLNCTCSISQSGALLMHTDGVCSSWLLKITCPLQIITQIFKKFFTKSKMAAGYLEISQVCGHFTMWSSWT